MPDITDHIDALRAAATDIRTEWTAATDHADGTVRYHPIDDEDHAVLIADSIATHLASLNEPTRKASGVTGIRIVRREVVVLPDGTQVTLRWQYVRDGRSSWNDEEG